MTTWFKGFPQMFTMNIRSELLINPMESWGKISFDWTLEGRTKYNFIFLHGPALDMQLPGDKSWIAY